MKSTTISDMGLMTSGHLDKLLAGILLTALLASAAALAQTTPTDGEALRAELHQHYPSLTWVERYRQANPAEKQGDTASWRGGPAQALDSGARSSLPWMHYKISTLRLRGRRLASRKPWASCSEPAAMVVWRHLDPAETALCAGDQVLDIDGQPVARWLEHAAVPWSSLLSSTIGRNQPSADVENRHRRPVKYCWIKNSV